MLSIQLSGLKFHAYHGLHSVEKELGGAFLVDVEVMFEPKSIPIHRLNETIDYTSIFQVVKERMNVPAELLETLATEIASDLFSSFLQVEDVKVKITKVSPPIPGFEGSASVKFEMKRYSSRRH